MEGELGNILQIDPDQRDHKAVLEIVEKLQYIAFFEKLKVSHGNEAVKECCARLKYRLYEPNQNIITYRDLGQEFFIILEGSAKIYIPVEFKMDGTKEMVKEYFDNNDVMLIPSSDLNEGSLSFFETLDYNENTGLGTYKIRLLK